VRRPGVVHRRQHPAHGQPRVEQPPDVVHGVEQLPDAPVAEHLARSGTTTSSAAASALIVTSPSDGEQSRSTTS
jgi:hypothetical protein